MKITIHPLSNAASVPQGVAADGALIKGLQESFRPLLGGEPSLAERFYARLFQANPQLRSMFPRDMANQKRKLLDTLNLVIENLHSPQMIRPRLQKLGESHVGYGARAEHYLDDPTQVRNIIADGCEKGRKLAQDTLRDVRDAMGLSYS